MYENQSISDLQYDKYTCIVLVILLNTINTTRYYESIVKRALNKSLFHYSYIKDCTVFRTGVTYLWIVLDASVKIG